MIQGKNLKTVFLTSRVVSDIIVPTVSATLAGRWRTPGPGRLMGVRVVASTAFTLGTAANLLETLVVNRNGVDGTAGPFAVSNVVKYVDQNAVPQIFPAIGRVYRIPGNGVKSVAGDQLTVVYTETGTPGTVTRSNFLVTEMEYELDQNAGTLNPGG